MNARVRFFNPTYTDQHQRAMFDITRACTHSYSVEFDFKSHYRPAERHRLIFIGDALFCYHGPLGARLFVDKITDKHRRWYRQFHDFSQFPTIRQLRKEAVLVKSEQGTDQFFRALYWALGKDFLKEKLAA